MIDPKVIEEMRVIWDVTDNDIGLLTGGQGADTVTATQGRGGVERQRRHNFAREHAHLRTSHRANKREIFGRTGPRIAVAGQCHRHAPLNQLPRRCVRQAEKERGAGSRVATVLD